MELLTSAYDSDSGDEANALQAVGKAVTTAPPQQPIIATNSVNPAAGSSKPRKRLDTSFLPQEIQDALMRRDLGPDSDDEGASSLQASVRAAVPAKHVTPGDDPLLRLLPPPKQQKDKQQSSLPLNKPSSPIHQARAAWQRTAPEVREPEEDHFEQRERYSDEADVSAFGIDPYAHSDAAQFAPQPAADNSSSSSRCKRKRERDLENQLMAGNTSELGNAHVVAISAYSGWDQHAYTDQQSKEAQIMKQYTGGGGSGAQPTKLQNRKHQLSSLALKAAETEIALLEARGIRQKTKSQTQGKYGW